MSALIRSSEFSAFQTPMRLRIGAGVLVLALHAAVAAFIVMGSHAAPAAAENESAMMVSVIDAPAPRQAPPQTERQPQPPAPAAALPAEPPPEPDAQARYEPEPPPIAHPSSLAPAIKPQPKPHPQPLPVRHPVPQTAAEPSAPAPAVADVHEGPQPTSQAPGQDQPVLVTHIEYDGPRPVPVYPRLSRLYNETGRVVVLVRISAQGQVQDARIDTSSGHERLDAAALDAARRARFKPFTRNGVAMPALARLPYDFQMKD
ncbi:MAG: energy transducer TonB [Bordetella sp.]|uniref:energy transducer TonB n=1 Tax=Bordetella sp. TaxID=28081 RepID=UPI003F7B753E